MSSISIYYNKIDYSHFWSLHLTLACSFFTTCVFFKLHTRICLNSRHLFFFILGSFSFGPNYNYFREVLPFSFHRSKKRIFGESLSSSQTMLQSSKFTINQATPLFPLRTLQSFFNSPSPTSSHIKMKRMSDYAKSFRFSKSKIRVHYHWKPSTMVTSQVHLLELNVVHTAERPFGWDYFDFGRPLMWKRPVSWWWSTWCLLMRRSAGTLFQFLV